MRLLTCLFATLMLVIAVWGGAAQAIRVSSAYVTPAEKAVVAYHPNRTLRPPIA